MSNIGMREPIIEYLIRLKGIHEIQKNILKNGRLTWISDNSPCKEEGEEIFKFLLQANELHFVNDNSFLKLVWSRMGSYKKQGFFSALVEEMKNDPYLSNTALNLLNWAELKSTSNLSPELEIDKEKSGRYRYIPYYPERFTDVILSMKKEWDFDFPIKFIDVGCGIGDKVALARMLLPINSEVYGVDLDEFYLHLAKELVYNYNSVSLLDKIIKYPTSFFCQDALKVNYKDYNFVYMYSPMFDEKKMFTLCNKVINEVKNGLVVNVLWHSWDKFLGERVKIKKNGLQALKIVNGKIHTFVLEINY